MRYAQGSLVWHVLERAQGKGKDRVFIFVVHKVIKDDK
jgi:hypothetical protein